MKKRLMKKITKRAQKRMELFKGPSPLAKNFFEDMLTYIEGLKDERESFNELYDDLLHVHSIANICMDELAKEMDENEDA